MSSHSLERLIGLAQKTGGKLIVHNPLEEHDVVILDVDEYEKLVMSAPDEFSSSEDIKEDVRELSGSEMLDKINRDIAIWRANKEQEEEWEKEMVLDEETEEEPSFNPFVERGHHSTDWHSVSDLINKKYSALSGAGDDELDFLEDDVGEEIKIEEVVPQINPVIVEPIQEKSNDFAQGEPIDIAQGEPKTVPFRPMGVDSNWQEEPLPSDEPVFYEEPV